MTTYKTLTPSGQGALVEDRAFTSFSADEIRALITERRWVAFRKHPVDGQAVLRHLRTLGNLVENDRRKDGILKLDGSKKEEGEVLLGEGFMPLHRDGALMGTNVALVGIYCVQHERVSGGRTFISDIESGLHEVPQDVQDLLRERGIEGKPVDSYYLKSSDVWHPIAGFLEVEGKSFLNVGFPYRAGEKASWVLRIPGVSDDKCATIFEDMRKIFMSEKYCYFHEWNEGEVLLLDNKRTLHGREAFEGRRSLANIQVLGA